MPRTSLSPDTNKNAGWVGSLEEIEDLQSKYGPEIVDTDWGGPSKPWFDWQKRVLTSTVDEIGLLAGKASGKSTVMRAWLVSGNPTEPDEDEDGRPIPVNRSYIYHGDYLGLILRRNQDDLTDFLIRAQRMWSSLGGEYKNGYFRFPTESGRPGARIDCGHLKDSNSWQKYIGIEYQRIAIDEAGLIPEYNLYDELRSCMRSPHPELRCQVILASNAGGPGTCVPHGEVLTPKGWVPIQNIRLGDFVYSVDIYGDAVFDRVDQVHHLDYTGELRKVSGRGLNILCTPDHKLAHRPRSESQPDKGFYRLEQFDSLPRQAQILRSVGWKGVPIGDFELEDQKYKGSKRSQTQPLKLNPRQFLTLLGWFISEGSTLHRTSDKVERLFNIVQGKSPHKHELRKFLDEDCKFNVYWQAKENGVMSATIHSAEWWRYFSQFGKARDKFLPDYAKNATVEQLTWLLDGLMSGDGSWGRIGSTRTKEERHKHKGSGIYYTCSKQLADDVSEICVKLGYIVYVKKREIRPPSRMASGRMVQGRDPAYEVNFKKVTHGCTEILINKNRSYTMSKPGKRQRSSDVSNVDFSGKVYCLGIRDNHTFIIRQNGSVWISGNCWLMDRFMKARDENGDLIPHDTVITEKYTHPFTNKEATRTRLWVFSTIKDNLVLRDTPYAVTLISLVDPKKRAAYFDGQWDALYGSYFGDLFRPDGPIASNGEPPNACHVITKSKTDGKYPIEIRPWWPMAIGGDWGYAHDAAFLWSRKDPNGRVIITDELSVDHVLPEKLGVEIGRRTKPHLELLPSHSMKLYLGHDAFANRTGDRTIAELIMIGIAKVLGPGTVHIPDLMIRKLKESWDTDAFSWETQQEKDKQIELIRLQRRMGITIEIAEKTGIISWQHCREYMRWESTVMSNVVYDPVIARRLLQENPKAFEEYCKLYRDVKPEILPKLQILDCCPKLIAAIPRAQHEDGTENIEKAHYSGRDLLDAFCYLLTGIDDETVQEPYETYRDRQLTKAVNQVPGMSCNDLVRVNVALEAEWGQKNKPLSPYTPPRQARARRLLRQGKMGDQRWPQSDQNTIY